MMFEHGPWNELNDASTLATTMSISAVLFTRCLIFLDRTISTLVMGIAPYRRQRIKILDIMILTMLMGLQIPLLQQSDHAIAILGTSAAMNWLVGIAYLIMRRQIGTRTYRSLLLVWAWWLIPIVGLAISAYLNMSAEEAFLAVLVGIATAGLLWCGLSFAIGWLIHVGWKSHSIEPQSL